MSFDSIITKIKQYRPFHKPKETWFTLGSILWFLVCTYIVCIANSYMDTNNPSVKLPEDQRTRLDDPLMDSVYPHYAQSTLPKNLPDTLVQISVAFIFLRVFLGGKNSFLILRRTLYVVGLVYLLRAPFIIMTVLPNPLLSCQSNPRPNIFYDALLLMAQVRYSCGDVLYSGHAILFLASALVWVDYPLLNKFAWNLLISLLLIIYVTLSLFALIVSSYHYTVDVAIAIFITLFFWKMYLYIVTTNTFDRFKLSRFLLFIDQERYTKAPIITPADTAMSMS